MTTCIVEYQTTHGHSILGYCGTLSYAQDIFERNASEFPTVSILKLTGDRFGEGYHQYRMVKRGSKWVKERPSYRTERNAA